MAKAVLVVDGGLYTQQLLRDPGHPTAHPAYLVQAALALSMLHGITVSEIHYFDAVINPKYHDFPGMTRNDEARRAFHKALLEQMQTEAGKDILIKTHIQHLKPMAIRCPEKTCVHSQPGKEVVRPVQAGVDVDIAAFLLTSLPPDVTHVYCFIGDGDFVPVIEALRRPQFGKTVKLVLFSETALSIGLRSVMAKSDIIFLSKLQNNRPELFNITGSDVPRAQPPPQPSSSPPASSSISRELAPALAHGLRLLPTERGALRGEAGDAKDDEADEGNDDEGAEDGVLLDTPDAVLARLPPMHNLSPSDIVALFSLGHSGPAILKAVRANPSADFMAVMDAIDV
ncbi:hypothetical protein PTSG_02907 [Salpingoeca rosetta]|uniref:Uncharacterized protein n=1 Tax=Salpingoeca rosetta (strain ATCC 50818 / BSB-021) TaxID=946362 RepID=F2U3P2_SALR5|nr:uncharacterized protein PTSG_02907 [Salpingoeca rosetta]EGD82236.1 hypothetical protein PTSG_02907 [Salpingoeca rosetta]|eukprot:XP_004996419.1 hypothetical protein PTSG_02907 [Salpingoeca rosetta]